jgi:ATP-dependent DNA helicase RecG
VLLGVEDGGEISGISRPDIEEWVMNVCRDTIRPAVIPYFEVVHDVEPGKGVAIVRVNRGYTVESVWRNNRHLYQIRVGSTTREPTPDELSRIFQQRGEFRAELRPVSGATLADLDLRRLSDYFGRVRSQETPDDSDADGWTRLLTNTEIMVEEGVTVAGLLLFGTKPNRFLPQAGIEAAAFPGLEKDYAARERLSIRGPLTPLMSRSGQPLETGVIERAAEFVRRNIGVTARLEDGVRRVERFDYPESAVREAVVNAMIHRDYLLAGVDVELSIYEDRLEVVSPGRLPNGITPERMRNGTRAARNQLLKDVMRDYGYLESVGMGVRLKIVRGMREHNGTEPDLIEESERFTVRLYK